MRGGASGHDAVFFKSTSIFARYLRYFRDVVVNTSDDDDGGFRRQVVGRKGG